MDEAVTHIRTVYSYGLEIPLMAEFTLALDENLKKASVTAIPKGFARCFSQGAMFIGFGFVYYFANRWILMGDVIKETAPGPSRSTRASWPEGHRESC